MEDPCGAPRSVAREISDARNTSIDSKNITYYNPGLGRGFLILSLKYQTFHQFGLLEPTGLYSNWDRSSQYIEREV